MDGSHELLSVIKLCSFLTVRINQHEKVRQKNDDSGIITDIIGSEGDDLYFQASKGGADDPVYTFTIESNLTESGSEVYETVKSLEIGQTVDMEGYLYWYEGANPHVVSVTVK